MDKMIMATVGLLAIIMLVWRIRDAIDLLQSKPARRCCECAACPVSCQEGRGTKAGVSPPNGPLPISVGREIRNSNKLIKGKHGGEFYGANIKRS